MGPKSGRRVWGQVRYTSWKVPLNDEQTARHTATAQFALCIALRGKNWRPLKSLYNVCRFQYYLVIYFNFSLSGLEYILWTRNLCDTIKLLVQLTTKLEGHSARWSACTCDKSQNPKIGQVWRPVAPQTYTSYTEKSTRSLKLRGPWTTTRSKHYFFAVHVVTCSLLWVRCLFDYFDKSSTFRFSGSGIRTMIRIGLKSRSVRPCLKTPFLCPWGRVALSCGWVAHGGRTNASCGPFAQWPERYHGCEQWRVHREGAVGAIATPPEWEWSPKSFSNNQFTQFVVIFLFQGLRNSSPITNLSPQDC